MTSASCKWGDSIITSLCAYSIATYYGSRTYIIRASTPRTVNGAASCSALEFSSSGDLPHCKIWLALYHRRIGWCPALLRRPIHKPVAIRQEVDPKSDGVLARPHHPAQRKFTLSKENEAPHAGKTSRHEIGGIVATSWWRSCHNITVRRSSPCVWLRPRDLASGINSQQISTFRHILILCDEEVRFFAHSFQFPHQSHISWNFPIFCQRDCHSSSAPR